jgi:dephospho-CoA kinase
MITIGITGGIGSGKSTLCNYLNNADVEIVYADSLAKSLMQENRELRDRIISVFGESAYLNDGTINREYLSHQAFSLNKIQMLNDLVHPVVKNEIIRMISNARQKGIKVFIYEAALLLKNGRPEYLDYVVWVDSDINNRAKRVSNRDSVDIQSVYHRIQHQQTFESVSEFVDIVILNDGNLADLKEKADQLYQQLGVRLPD